MGLMGIALLLLSGVEKEFIYEEAPFPSCHASTLVETGDGSILAAWFGGADEGERDVAIWSSRRDAKGWSAPAKTASDPSQPCWNPVLFREEGEGGRARIWLFYKAGRNPESWSGFYRRSEDEGRSFEPARLLPAGILGPIKNKPLPGPGGELLCGSSVESYNAWAAWVEVLDPRTEAWRKHGPIAFPEKPRGVIQPALVKGDPPGAYRMFLRSTQSIGKVCVADSVDGGRTWTPARATSLPNPNSGLDAVRLRDGRVLLVHNDTPMGRTPLTISVSSDLGDTWRKVLDLETEPGEYSYPAVIELRSGEAACTYTWKRKRIRFARIPLESLGR